MHWLFTVSASPTLTTRLPLIIVRKDAFNYPYVNITSSTYIEKLPIHKLIRFAMQYLKLNQLIDFVVLVYKYSTGSSLAALKSEETWHRDKLDLYSTRPANENRVLALYLDSHRKTSVCFNKHWFRFTLISGGSSILWRNFIPLVSAIKVLWNKNTPLGQYYFYIMK